MNIKEGKLDISVSQNFVTQEIFKRWMPEKLKFGDILMTSEAPLGAVAIFKEESDFCLGQRLFGLRAKTSKLDQQYFFWTLQTPLVQNQLITRSTGSTAKGVRQSELLQVQIPLPSLDEQQRIAAILDKADAVRRKRSHAIQLTEELLRATFLEIVGSKHPAYEQWVEVSLADLALPGKNSMRTGPFGSTLLHSEFVEEGIAVLGIDNAVQNRFAWGERRFISLGKYEELKRYTVNPEDVIITIMGTTGRSAVVPEDIPTAIVTKHLATITLDRSKALPEYLSNAIHREPEVLRQIAVQNRGAIMAGLNLGIIKQLKLRLPPLEQQLLYDKVVKKTRHQQEKFEKAAKTADILFNTLLHRAFRGEL